MIVFFYCCFAGIDIFIDSSFILFFYILLLLSSLLRDKGSSPCDILLYCILLRMLL